MTTDNKSTLAEKLQELYQDPDDTQYQEFFDWAANCQRYRWETTFEKIQNSLSAGSMEDAKEIAKKMDEIGAGEYKRGVRGRKSHVAWAFRVDSIGSVARGDDGAELIAPGGESAGGEDSGWGNLADEADEYVTHTFHLRKYEKISITLPADITRKEADKLGDFVKLLSFEPTADWE